MSDDDDDARSKKRIDAEFLDSIVENIPNMIFLKDARELRFVRFNRAGEELLGYSREELIGKNDYDFFPKEEADFFTQKDREVLEGKQVVDIPEESIHTRHHGTRILHTKKIPILGHDGEPLYLLGISEDITDKKNLEAERRRREELELAKRASDLFADRLRRSEARLASMIQGIPDGIAVVDASGSVIDVNASAIEILGASDRSELLGPAERLLSRIALRDGEAAKPASWDAIRMRTAGGESSSQEGAIERPEGPSVAVVLMAFPLEREQEAQRTLLVIRDVTEQKRLESLRDEFLSIAAHELKTPLATIKGYAELIPSWAPDEMAARGPKALAAIHRQCGRLNRLVQELLEVSRLQLGRLELQLRTIDLEPLVRQVVAELKPAARGNRLTIIHSEPLRVRADPDRLEQVLANLISNAISFSPTGGAIDVNLERRGDEAVVTVRDRGIGIPAERQAGIFGRYYQAHKGTPYASTAGLGMGLHISRELVRRHGGDIGFESVEEEGSTFYFTLPLAPDAGDAPRA